MVRFFPSKMITVHFFLHARWASVPAARPLCWPLPLPILRLRRLVMLWFLIESAGVASRFSVSKPRLIAIIKIRSPIRVSVIPTYIMTLRPRLSIIKTSIAKMTLAWTLLTLVRRRTFVSLRFLVEFLRFIVAHECVSIVWHFLIGSCPIALVLAITSTVTFIAIESLVHVPVLMARTAASSSWHIALIVMMVLKTRISRIVVTRSLFGHVVAPIFPPVPLLIKSRVFVRRSFVIFGIRIRGTEISRTHLPLVLGVLEIVRSRPLFVVCRWSPIIMLRNRFSAASTHEGVMLVRNMLSASLCVRLWFWMHRFLDLIIFFRLNFLVHD